MSNSKSEQYYYEQIEFHHNSGRYEIALHFANEGIEDFPFCGFLYGLRGEIYLSKQMIDEAKVSFETAIQLGVDEPAIFNNLGLCYGASREYLQAIECFTNVIELGVENENIYLARAKAYRDSGKPELAKLDEVKAAELNMRQKGKCEIHGVEFEEIEVKFDVPLINYTEEHWEIKKLVEKHLAENPLEKIDCSLFPNAGIRIRRKRKGVLGDCFWYLICPECKRLKDQNDKQIDEQNKKLYQKYQNLYVIEKITKKLNSDPKNSRIYLDRGYNYWIQEQFIEAAQDFKNAVEIDSNALDYFYEILKVRDFNILGPLNISKLIDLDPIECAKLSYAFKEYNQSIMFLDKAIDLDFGNYWAYRIRAYIHEMFGRYNLAILDYTKIIEHESENFEDDPSKVDFNSKNFELISEIVEFGFRAKVLAYQGRGGCHYKLKEYKKGIANYTKLIEFYPEFHESYKCRGTIYYDLGKYDQALTDFNKALEFDPNNEELIELRKKALNQLNKSDLTQISCQKVNLSEINLDVLAEDIKFLQEHEGKYLKESVKTNFVDCLEFQMKSKLKWNTIKNIPNFPFNNFAEIQKGVGSGKFTVGIDFDVSNNLARWLYGRSYSFIIGLLLATPFFFTGALIIAAIIWKNYWLLIGFPLTFIGFASGSVHRHRSTLVTLILFGLLIYALWSGFGTIALLISVFLIPRWLNNFISYRNQNKLIGVTINSEIVLIGLYQLGHLGIKDNKSGESYWNREATRNNLLEKLEKHDKKMADNARRAFETIESGESSEE